MSEEKRQNGTGPVHRSSFAADLSGPSLRDPKRDMAIEPPGAEVIYTAAMIAAHWTANNPGIDPSRCARAAVKQVQDHRKDGKLFDLYRYWRMLEKERIDAGIGDQRSAPAQEATQQQE